MKPLLVSAALSAVGVLCLLLFLRGSGGGEALLPLAIVLVGFLVGTFVRRLFSRGASRLGRWRGEGPGAENTGPPAPHSPRAPQAPRSPRTPRPPRAPRPPRPGPP